MYPTYEQRAKIREWFGTYRFVYNKAIADIKKGTTNKFVLKNKHVTAKNNDTLHDWELLTPKAIRQQAVYDAAKAFTTCLSQLKIGLIHGFDLKFKKRKQKKTSIGIENCSSLRFEHINNKPSLQLYPEFMQSTIKIGKRQAKEVQNMSINQDCRLSFDGYSLWLCIPVPIEKREYKCRDNDAIIALDPGTRTFQTGFDARGCVVECHRNDELLKKLKERMSVLQSLRAKRQIKGKDRKKYMKKLNDCIDDFHWQTVKSLTSTYGHVLLPHFESQEMKQQRLSRGLNRDLDIFKHYKFKRKLYFKARLSNTRVYDVNESYTTKTCTNCGVLNNTVGSKTVFDCDSCGLRIDRDTNGSRNIFLKHVS